MWSPLSSGPCTGNLPGPRWQRSCSSSIREAAHSCRGLSPRRQRRTTTPPMRGRPCSAPIQTTPRVPQAWPPAARAADREGPYFGSFWTYLSLPCADWPSRSHDDRSVGPFDLVTANPVLVVGNRFDPATPYEGARALTHDLGNARLLTLDGWGHTASL